MPSTNITLPDNSIKSFDHKPTVLQVAESIGAGLAKATLGGRINGEKNIIDLRAELSDGTRLEIVTAKSDNGVEVLRHSCAHLLAQAVQEIWPEVKVTIGPVIDNGFYYDFDSPFAFTEADLEKIESKMSEIVKRNDEVVREVWSFEKAIETFTEMGERFKVELIQGLQQKGGEEIGIYRQGQWFDLCRGPHVKRMGEIKAFKLLSVASAYWRGDETKESLQRIYGTAFADKKQLKEHLELLEEAKKRDHRKLGKELKLFHFHDFSPGMPFFSAKGTIVYNQLVDLMREMYSKHGYKEVITPQIYDVELYKQSGHYENYRENMYFTSYDEREFSLKPMNCPGHCLHYASDKFSYRDLPFRVADFGRLHRCERSGTLHGLTRVRSFSQDDAHIFCTPSQLFDEIKGVIEFLDTVYATLGMSNYRIYLSTRPEKRIGADEVWDRAEKALSEALEALDLPFEVNEGDGAFYGPKLDIMFVDALKRDWQLGTVQLDFNLPERFDLKFTGDDNSDHRPVMIHRAILGSLERFIGVYLEHVGGHLPSWLAPVQVQVLNVTDRVNDYCRELVGKMESAGLRCFFDSRSEKLNYKIREAQLSRIPYMMIIGDKEVEDKLVSLRMRTGETLQAQNPQEIIDKITEEVHSRSFESAFKELASN